ncbi:MAG TPA: DNA replication/repair protein RecF [Dokdonella sp.]
MELRQLRIDNLRLFEHVEIEPEPGWNLFLGANGAGKTSVLEAAFLLSHGRSFRTSLKDALVRRGTNGYAVFGELHGAEGSSLRRVGLARNAGGLEARLEGEVVPAAELMRHTAVLCFEPGSHELVSGASEERRRFLDWGVFHVEHEFLAIWRRYQRALKQRNALLRAEPSPSALDAWDHELAQSAEPLVQMRARYFQSLEPLVVALLAELLSELGAARLRFDAGYDLARDFQDVLAAQRGRDLARGYTASGPHRMDWSISFEQAPRREHLSRGQEKLCAFAAVMAQAHLFRQTSGEWPILCLDDLASEVDRDHQERIVASIAASAAQVFVTGTQEPEALAKQGAPLTRFHVEQGHVTRLL